MQAQPYLFFDGRCEEALAFYRDALGAEVTELHRFQDSPERHMVPPGAENKVMHASFRIGDSTVHASDGSCAGQAHFQGFSLSLTVPNDAEAERRFARLADGGQVQMPLTKTFFASRFGMVADRFGAAGFVDAHRAERAAAFLKHIAADPTHVVRHLLVAHFGRPRGRLL